jgi:heme A synthase
MADLEDQQSKRRIVGMALMGSAVMMTIVALLAYSGVFEVSSGVERTVALVLGGVAVLDFAMALYFLMSNPS